MISEKVNYLSFKSW